MAKRLIDANAIIKDIDNYYQTCIFSHPGTTWSRGLELAVELLLKSPTVDAVEVVHGRWIYEAHKENANYRWNVTAECANCCDEKKEVWAGFFPGIPDDIADSVALQSAESVKISNYCPNCGAKMDGGMKEGE